MSTLKQHLVRLGTAQPHLRKHLRPILASLEEDEALIKRRLGKGQEFYDVFLDLRGILPDELKKISWVKEADGFYTYRGEHRLELTLYPGTFFRDEPIDLRRLDEYGVRIAFAWDYDPLGKIEVRIESLEEDKALHRFDIPLNFASLIKEVNGRRSVSDGAKAHIEALVRKNLDKAVKLAQDVVKKEKDLQITAKEVEGLVREKEEAERAEKERQERERAKSPRQQEAPRRDPWQRKQDLKRDIERKMKSDRSIRNVEVGVGPKGLKVRFQMPSLGSRPHKYDQINQMDHIRMVFLGSLLNKYRDIVKGTRNAGASDVYNDRLAIFIDLK